MSEVAGVYLADPHLPRLNRHARWIMTYGYVHTIHAWMVIPNICPITPRRMMMGRVLTFFQSVTKS